MQAATASERRAATRQARRGAMLALPALLWTAAFFLVPLAVMIAYSLMKRSGGRLQSSTSSASRRASSTSWVIIKIVRENSV